MKEPENVSVDDPPLLDGTDDAGEVVVGDHHVGVLLGDLGPLDAHGDTDVRFFQGRGVVHSVARHGDNVPLLLQCLDDLQLVLGETRANTAASATTRFQPSTSRPASSRP